MRQVSVVVVDVVDCADAMPGVASAPCGPIVEKQTAPDQGAVAKRITWAGSLPASGVGTKAGRKIHQRRNTAPFGAPAPVLKLAQELFLGGVRALPKRAKLVAHRNHRREGTRILQRLGEAHALRAGGRLAAQQRALEGAQHLGIARRPALEPL